MYKVLWNGHVSMHQPLSLEIKQKLLSAITNGRYRSGSLLPTIRALAETFRVSTKTVQKAVKELSNDGFLEPKPGKGLIVKMDALQAKRSRRIVVPLPYSASALKSNKVYPGAVIAALRRGVAKAGYEVVAVPLNDMEELAIIRHLRALQPAGIVLCEIDSDHLIIEIRELMLPMVSIDYDAFHLGISSVAFDNRWGGFEATRYFIRNGHRHIVALNPQYTRSIGGNPFMDTVEEERTQGYRLAMQNADLDPRIEVYPPGTRPMRAKLLELFGLRPAPTALLCQHSGQARVVARELQTMGFRIPEDVSLIGFGADDAELAPGVKVSSVWVDCEGMGRTAAEFLLAEMKGEGDDPRRCRLPTRLVVHNSVARIGAAVAAATEEADA